MSKIAATFETLMTGVEGALDRFFGGMARGVHRFCEKYLEYIFLETKEGVFGIFDTPEKIKAAAKAAHAKGYTQFDCFTPFPIHGLEFDMGLKRSKVPYITFFAAFTGTTIAFLLQWGIHEQVSTIPYMNSYPMNIGGKSTFAWPAMVPILFELSVLLGGLSTAAGLLLLSKMPRPGRKPLHPSFTDDKFGLWIPSISQGYSVDGVKQFLSEIGAQEITVVAKS